MGERRVFEGVLLEWHDSRTETDHMMIRGEHGNVGRDLDDVVKGLDGARVRVTVEVLEPAQATAAPAPAGRAPAVTSVVPAAVASAGSDDWTDCAVPWPPKEST